MTPAEKLDRSRLAIVEYLARRGHRGEPRARSEPAGGHDAGNDGSEASDGDDGSADGWFGRLSSVARAWWRQHPAQLAVELATPALQSYMRRRPFQVLALSAGVGALLVITRPWRLISLTTVVVAIVKSSQMSGVVMSALSDAQGWQKQREGREPHL